MVTLGLQKPRWSLELEDKIQSNPLWANMRYYSIERKSRDIVLGWFDELAPGKDVLDYCCGNGADGIYIAHKGAKSVIGIVISDISIDNCRELAKQEGVTTAAFQVADAENTSFADSSCDVVTEYGSLHHLDLEYAIPEIARNLKQDGIVICNEVRAHNPIIHAYWRLTPKSTSELLPIGWTVSRVI